MLVVVDASIAAKWFFIEEYSEIALRLLDNPFELHAPDLLFIELDSILSKRFRRNEISSGEAFDIHDEIYSMSIQTYHTLNLGERAFEMALETRASIYDCIYLSLAELLECRMVTADHKLFRALDNGPLCDFMLWIKDLETS